MDLIGRSYFFALRYLPLHPFEEWLMVSCAALVESVETK